MAGQHHFFKAMRCLLLLLVLALLVSPAAAQPREATGPVGGITFDPPRKATIRHKSRQLIRGDIIGMSEELVHFRVSNGKEFHYPLKDIRAIATVDGEFKYTSAYDTYREAVNSARGLTGVTIDAAAAVAGTGKPVTLPRPPAPSLPQVVDPPESYSINEEIQVANAGPAVVPGIPRNQPPTVPPAAGGAGAPFYESNAFKVGFLVACLAVVVLWWRNKVG